MRAKIRTPRRLPLVLAGLALAGLGASQLPQALASTPASQILTIPSAPGVHTVHFTGHAPFNNGQANLLFDDQTGACDGSTTALRDEHTVTLSVPHQPSSAYDVLIRFEIDWTFVNEPLADMRLDLFGPDNKLVASSDSSQFQESINLTKAVPGKYSMHVCAFQDNPNGQDYTGLVSASVIKPKATPTSQPGIKTPTYKQFQAPKGISTDAGEPSIGNNWKSNHTFFTSNTHEYDVAFNDTAGSSTWTPVNVKSPNGSNITSLDPIGFTDQTTGRTFVSQLLFVCSGAVYTDNDFKSVVPSQGCGSGINGFDHQTFGGGPYPKGMKSLTGYPHAIYYCSQAQALVLGNAACSRSDTGGVTFGAPVPVWNGACSGLHGHVRVAPDGTVYLPNGNCHGRIGVGVSTDAGKTWTIRTVPGSVNAESDPSVSAGSDGTVYLGWADGTGRPMVAVSRDHGATWKVSNIGTAIGVHNTEFAETIAGDGDRAAFAFLGTPTSGSTQADTFGKSADGKTFTGARWDMYVATTYDRGVHWTIVDATPTDPVQRGCIWNAGGSNPCRNLLDFNDITTDKTGRVMVAFADGCVPASIDSSSGNNCVASNAVAANALVQHGTIVRQESGKGLFKKYDGVLPGSGGTTSGTTTSSHPSSGGGGSLATTGATPWLAGFGLLMMLLAGGVWRRRKLA
jgi:hypothetical protein